MLVVTFEVIVDKMAMVQLLSTNDLGYGILTLGYPNWGFNQIYRKPHPEDPETAIAVRFIMVKEVWCILLLHCDRP